jgi:hypothetical protein
MHAIDAIGPETGRVKRAVWPESWSILSGALVLGALAWIAFGTRVLNPERLPAETIFGFLGLYFYSVGFLSGRRTGQAGKGTWAGAVCGLVFGVVVCAQMVFGAMNGDIHETIRAGAMNQVAIGWSGLVFFIVMGGVCGRLGARSAIQAGRQARQDRGLY